MAESSIVIVSNISPQLEEHHLRELFECCGGITSMRLNKSLGQCTVQFGEGTHARAAVFLSGTTLGDRPLSVTIQQPTSAVPPANVWHSGVPPPNFGAPPAGVTGGLIPNHIYANNPGTLEAANEKKMEEIQRTVYIGNVNCDLTEQQLVDFFTDQCGPIVIVKMAGETLGKPSRFAFVEFYEIFAAQKALSMDGSTLAGLALKIRKANNAILKPAAAAHTLSNQQKDVNEIMKKVLAHTQGIGSKLDRSRSRSRERSRRSSGSGRDRDRDRDRRSSRDGHRRSRSRDRDRDRRSSRDGGKDGDDRRCYNCGGRGHISRNCKKSRSRSPRGRGGAREAAPAKPVDDHAGMFFNGYKWEPIESMNAGGAPGGPPQALPLGGIRAALIQQQQAMNQIRPM